MLQIALTLPLEVGGMGGFMGYLYDALKDFLTWSVPNGYSKKQILWDYIPIFLDIGQHLASVINRNKTQ